MATPFKMNGPSLYSSPMKQKKGPTMPKGHHVTPPRENRVDNVRAVGGNVFGAKSFLKEVKQGFSDKLKAIKKNPNRFND